METNSLIGHCDSVRPSSSLHAILTSLPDSVSVWKEGRTDSQEPTIAENFIRPEQNLHQFHDLAAPDHSSQSRLSPSPQSNSEMLLPSDLDTSAMKLIAKLLVPKSLEFQTYAICRFECDQVDSQISLHEFLVLTRVCSRALAFNTPPPSMQDGRENSTLTLHELSRSRKLYSEISNVRVATFDETRFVRFLWRLLLATDPKQLERKLWGNLAALRHMYPTNLIVVPPIDGLVTAGGTLQ